MSGDWDDSLRYTIANSLHYAILAVALVMPLGFLGISFGDLALVAGGLGVGIGFGLQNIVNNFYQRPDPPLRAAHQGGGPPGHRRPVGPGQGNPGPQHDFRKL